MSETWMQKLRCVLAQAPCVVCAQPGAELCVGCRKDLPYNRHGCRYCGLPLIQTGTCASCLRSLPPITHCHIPWRYRFPMDALICALKFNRRLDLAPVLARMLATSLRASGAPLPDLLLPVASDRGRLRTRGYNQALELARPLARELHLPLKSHLLQRQGLSRPQIELPARQRHSNVRNAFFLSEPLPVTRIALLDDVVTTGSTAFEIARLLRRAGATEIHLWALARASIR